MTRGDGYRSRCQQNTQASSQQAPAALEDQAVCRARAGRAGATLFAVLYWFLLGPGSIAQPPATPRPKAPAPAAAPVARSTRLKPVSLPRDDGPHATATSGGITTRPSFGWQRADVFVSRGGVPARRRGAAHRVSRLAQRVSARLTLYPATAYGRCSKGRGRADSILSTRTGALPARAEHQLKFGSDEFSIELSL